MWVQQIPYNVPTLTEIRRPVYILSHNGSVRPCLNINNTHRHTIDSMVQTHIPLYRQLKACAAGRTRPHPCPPGTHPSWCIYKEGLACGLARLGSANRLGMAWLGLASARLYYTAPYRFGIDVSCTCPLVHWLGLVLACCVWSADIPYDVPLPSSMSSGIHAVTQWLGLAWACGTFRLV